MIYGETGMRQLIPSQPEGMSTGKVYLSRSGKHVRLRFSQVLFTVANPFFGTLPVGFRPPDTIPFSLYIESWPTLSGTGNISAAGSVNLFRMSLDKVARGEIIFYTQDAWPTILPGLPA